MRRTFIAICCLLSFAAAARAQTATLKMRFVFDGKPPVPDQIVVNPAIAPLIGPLSDESLLVDPQSKGIKNVVVHLYTRHNRTKLELPEPKKQKRKLTMANGRFTPRVLIARAGDSVEFIERGPIQYNPNVNFFANHQRGIFIPRGKPIVVPLTKPEPAPVPVDCNIHPWMRAYLVVLEHPFVAVSDSDGNLTIDGLPANTSLTFRVFQESARIDRLKIDGVITDLNRSRFEVDLGPGVTDLGDVLVPPDSFGR